jgi:hypothetical protein
MSYYILSVFALILIASIIMQIQNARLKEICKYLDHATLIPIASVFAPNPPWYDVEILYRDKLSDDRITVWRMASTRRSPFWGVLFWCPTKRWRKQVLSLTQGLLRQVRNELRSECPTDRICLSFVFVMFATYVARQVHSPMSDYTQFMVVFTSGFEQKTPAILFISPFYRL